MTTLFASLFRRAEKRRAYADLLRLDDRLLRDVGLNRIDVQLLLSQPHLGLHRNT